VERKHDSCKECRVIHSLSTGCADAAADIDNDPVDIMDIPDLFSDLYDEENRREEAPRTPQERRSAGRPTGSQLAAPRLKDSSVRLPNAPVMAPALVLAYSRGDLVTSGSEGYSGDGVHSTTSQHYQGTALDVRYSSNRARQIADYRRTGLVVIPETTHLHIQAYRVSA